MKQSKAQVNWGVKVLPDFESILFTFRSTQLACDVQCFGISYRLQEWSPRQSVEWRRMLPNARIMKPRRDKNKLTRNLETKLKD